MAFAQLTYRENFTRVAPLDEIRAKEGNLSIPLYVSGQAHEAQQERAGYGAEALPEALSAWLESSKQVRRSLEALLAGAEGKSKGP